MCLRMTVLRTLNVNTYRLKDCLKLVRSMDLGHNLNFGADRINATSSILKDKK